MVKMASDIKVFVKCDHCGKGEVLWLNDGSEFVSDGFIIAPGLTICLDCAVKASIVKECPSCAGVGQVPHYQNKNAHNTEGGCCSMCHTCKGEGYVWS